MENTDVSVIVSKTRYDQLIEFEEKIKNGYSLVVKKHFVAGVLGYAAKTNFYYTTEEIHNNLIQEIEKLKEIIKEEEKNVEKERDETNKVRTERNEEYKENKMLKLEITKLEAKLKKMWF